MLVATVSNNKSFYIHVFMCATLYRILESFFCIIITCTVTFVVLCEVLVTINFPFRKYCINMTLYSYFLKTESALHDHLVFIE